MELHFTGTGCHLPYGITQCYLPPDMLPNTPCFNPSHTGQYSIYRPQKDGGLSKLRPRVQRATGPQLLCDHLWPARLEP